MISINAIDGVTGLGVLLKSLDGSVVEPLLTELLASPSLATNAFGTVTKWTAKASAGDLLAIHVTNANAAQRYLQVHNTAAVPAGGAVPVYSFVIPAGTAANPGLLVLTKEFFGAGGGYFATGISLAISTTLGTFTDSATAADHVAHAHYL